MSADRVHNGSLETSVSIPFFFWQNETDIQAKRFPITTFTQTFEYCESIVGFFPSRKGTNPAEKDKDIFEKDTSPFPIVRQVVCGDSYCNSKVVEHQECYESPIQCRSPVSIEACTCLLGSHND